MEVNNRRIEALYIINISYAIMHCTGCLQNQANKIPGFFQDFQEFFKQFSRINYYTKYIIIWNNYITTSLVTYFNFS